MSSTLLCMAVLLSGLLYCGEAGIRCNGQNDGCCTKKEKCDLGQGDCDNNDQCDGALTCGKDNCKQGTTFSKYDDCCEGIRCNGQNDGCCTEYKPCDLGQGDC